MLLFVACFQNQKKEEPPGAFCKFLATPPQHQGFFSSGGTREISKEPIGGKGKDDDRLTKAVAATGVPQKFLRRGCCAKGFCVRVTSLHYRLRCLRK